MLALAIIPNLAACSWLFGDQGTFRDRGDDYRRAAVEKKLELPTGVSADAIYDSYAIPPIADNTTLTQRFEIPGPEPLSEDLGRENVRINKLGDDRWILVNGAPGQVWPRLRNFLTLNNLTLQRIDAAKGLLETDWITPALEGAVRERYQLRIEQGVQRETSEIYVLQASLAAGLEDWPDQSSDKQRETLLSDELAQFLANSPAAAVSMLAQQTIDSSGKVTIEEYSGAQPYIKLQLPFSRAWASLRRALTKAGYQIDDLDRSQRLFYVNYSEQQASGEESGFFASLFGGDDEVSTDAVAYLVKVKESDSESVEITIEVQEPDAVGAVEPKTLLKLIKRHIS
jgi:outer membrane protein assembly factor BamC